MVAALRSYAEKYPDHEKVSDAIFLVARQLEAEKKMDDAIAEYRGLITKAVAKPSDEKLFTAAVGAVLRISALEFTKDPKTALQSLDAFLQQFKDQPVAARAIITEIRSTYQRTKQYSDGYTKLEQLVGQYQHSTAVRLAGNTAMIEMALGEKNYKRAEANVLKLLADPEKDNLPPLSYAAIGNTYLRTGKNTEAVPYFEKMLDLAKDDPKMKAIANFGLAQAYIELKQFDKTAPLLLPLQTDPNSPSPNEVNMALAKTYEATAKIKDAVKLFHQVMADKSATRDQSAEAAYRLGLIYFNNLIDPDKPKDNKKVALAYFSRLFFAAGPMADEASFRSAQCHQAQGNIEMARKAYKMYLARFKDGKFARQATEAIEKLPPPAAP
jgi:tetratricopeptide (TPR) repeat protein